MGRWLLNYSESLHELNELVVARLLPLASTLPGAGLTLVHSDLKKDLHKDLISPRPFGGGELFPIPWVLGTGQVLMSVCTPGCSLKQCLLWGGKRALEGSAHRPLPPPHHDGDRSQAESRMGGTGDPASSQPPVFCLGRQSLGRGGVGRSRGWHRHSSFNQH